MNHDTDPKRQLRFSIAILLALLVVGTAGFYLLGQDRTLFDALWMAVHVLTTVGDAGPVHPNQRERAWIIVLMLAGVLTVLYVGVNLVALIVEGELRQILGRRRLDTKINALKDHFIVCGFGRMGHALCLSLSKRQTPFVLIEHDPELTAEADSLGFLYLQGDAMSEQMLQRAGIERATGLASCLGDDSHNVFVTLSARGLNPNLTIIARCEDAKTEPKLRRAGANRVINPTELGANRAAQMLMQPAVVELMELAVAGPEHVEISKVNTRQLPAAIGKTLMDLALPARTGLMVVATVNPDGTPQFNPPPHQQLESNQELIVIGPPGSVDHLLNLLGAQAGDAAD